MKNYSEIIGEQRKTSVNILKGLLEVFDCDGNEILKTVCEYEQISNYQEEGVVIPVQHESYYIRNLQVDVYEDFGSIGALGGFIKLKSPDRNVTTIYCFASTTNPDSSINFYMKTISPCKKRVKKSQISLLCGA